MFAKNISEIELLFKINKELWKLNSKEINNMIKKRPKYVKTHITKEDIDGQIMKWCFLS